MLQIMDRGNTSSASNLDLDPPQQDSAPTTQTADSAAAFQSFLANEDWAHAASVLAAIEPVQAKGLIAELTSKVGDFNKTEVHLAWKNNCHIFVFVIANLLDADLVRGQQTASVEPDDSLEKEVAARSLLAFELCSQFLATFKVESTTMLKSWASSDRSNNLKEVVHSNLLQVIEMELALPGAISFLQEKCGINCLVRYGSDILIRQAKILDPKRFGEAPNKKSNYGIIITAIPEDEDISAFSGGFNISQPTIDSIQRNCMREDSEVIIIEPVSPLQMINTSEFLVEQMGTASWMVLRSHANRNFILMFRSENGTSGSSIDRAGLRDDLGASQVIPRLISRLTRANAPLVIEGCSAGQPGKNESIAELLARATSRTTIAPVGISQLGKLDFTRKDQAYQVMPHFKDLNNQPVGSVTFPGKKK